MIDGDVIIPVTTATDQTYILATIALRTCQASTSARVWAVINNSPEGILRDRLIRECMCLGIGRLFWKKPFSLTKIFNWAADITKGEYIAFGTSDVIYYPRWFENIVELWKENPEYFCLVNYSFDTQALPCTRHTIAPIRKIINTHNPSSGVTVFKRSSCFRWDEAFTLWEMDADLNLFLDRNNLKAGYCLNARCDHLVDCVKSQVHGQSEWAAGARETLEKKWNLPKPV